MPTDTTIPQKSIDRAVNQKREEIGEMCASTPGSQFVGAFLNIHPRYFLSMAPEAWKELAVHAGSVLASQKPGLDGAALAAREIGERAATLAIEEKVAFGRLIESHCVSFALGMQTARRFLAEPMSREDFQASFPQIAAFEKLRDGYNAHPFPRPYSAAATAAVLVHSLAQIPGSWLGKIKSHEGQTLLANGSRIMGHHSEPGNALGLMEIQRLVRLNAHAAGEPMDIPFKKALERKLIEGFESTATSRDLLAPRAQSKP